MAIKKRNKLLPALFLLCFVTFGVFIFKAGFAFSHHSYYIVPFVPVMALLAGYALSQIKNRKIAIAILIIISAEGLINQQHDFRIGKEKQAYLELENYFNLISKKDDLILINSGQQPTPMYFAHRKGWLASNEEIQNKEFIQQLKAKGLGYILILKMNSGDDLILDYNQVYENENFKIYKL